MRPVQHFSSEYLERCKALSPVEIVRFLDDFKLIHQRSGPVKTKLISMKVEENLLVTFKTQVKLDGVPYQSLIKLLMREWLQERTRQR